MNLQDVIAIASFSIAMAGIIYAFGQRDSRLSALERDVNNLGIKLESINNKIHIELKAFDKRADSQSVFMVRVDQRVRHIQEASVGEKRTDRLRESDFNQDDSVNFYSENSGIEL
jgi:hypothetical protein